MKFPFLTTILTLLSVAILSCSAQDKPEGAKANTANLKDINAIIKTADGDIHIKLYASKTPVTVANFCNLAQRGYYVGSDFHRVVPGFVSQGGKHMSGAASPGYTIKNETYTENPKIAELKHSKAGMLSMARTQVPHTNGAQWYITHSATPALDGQYTVFGEVTKGLEIATNLKRGTAMKDIIITDDTTPLYATQKENLAAWNKVLSERFFKLRPVGGAKKEEEEK